jgi:hypothetical protein
MTMSKATAPDGASTVAPKPIASPIARDAPAEAFVIGGRPPVEDAAVRPFQFRASDEELADLKRRIVATRWPDRETIDDDSQGVQLATIQKLADYWATHYDWRRCEARLNAFPNFITEIDGLDIHFIHVRSRHENPLPIIVTHGWPGSIVEQLKIIAPLTDPTAFGGTAEDALMSSSRRFPATAFPADRPPPAGIPHE